MGIPYQASEGQWHPTSVCRESSAQQDGREPSREAQTCSQCSSPTDPLCSLCSHTLSYLYWSPQLPHAHSEPVFERGGTLPPRVTLGERIRFRTVVLKLCWPMYYTVFMLSWQRGQNPTSLPLCIKLYKHSAFFPHPLPTNGIKWSFLKISPFLVISGVWGLC